LELVPELTIEEKGKIYAFNNKNILNFAFRTPG
jgi:hypothetical protein